MFIHEMSESQCRTALEAARFCRLACVKDNQPYIVPIYFAFHGEYIYGFTTVGQKVEWMRANPQVCLEIDEFIGPNDWMSVVVFGWYEELLDEPEYAPARATAHQLLQRRAMWWEPAYVATEHRDIPHSSIPIFYRIRIARMTGHRAITDQEDTSSEDAELSVKHDWFDKILNRIRIKDKHIPTS